MILPDLNLSVQECLNWLRHWRVPPHWSWVDWQDEVAAQAQSAAWEALGDYDASRNVPLSAFVYRRVISRVFTRYRQEWNYAVHCESEADRAEYANVMEGLINSSEIAHMRSISQPAINKRKRAILQKLRNSIDTVGKC